MEIEILDFIYKVNPYNYANLKAFVTQKNIVNVETFKSALTTLYDEGIVRYKKMIIPLPDNILEQKEILVGLTDQGRRDVQDRIVHQSTLKTNRAIRVTSMCSVIIAVVTGTFIGLTWSKNDSPDLGPVSSKLERMANALDSIRNFKK